MDAKKCDRCGRYYENNSKPTFALCDVSERRTVDLCKECSLELSEWFMKKHEESEGNPDEN